MNDYTEYEQAQRRAYSELRDVMTALVAGRCAAGHLTIIDADVKKVREQAQMIIAEARKTVLLD